MLEEYLMNTDGLIVTDSTWTYKIPTVDTIPRQFNVEILNSGHHKNRVLSSKGDILVSRHVLTETEGSLLKSISFWVLIQLPVNRRCF